MSLVSPARKRPRLRLALDCLHIVGQPRLARAFSILYFPISRGSPKELHCRHRHTRRVTGRIQSTRGKLDFQSWFDPFSRFEQRELCIRRYRGRVYFVSPRRNTIDATRKGVLSEIAVLRERQRYAFYRTRDFRAGDSQGLPIALFRPVKQLIQIRLFFLNRWPKGSRQRSNPV
jgi:hypothetical protein